MTYRLNTLALAALMFVAGAPVQAQGLRLQNDPERATIMPVKPQVQADFIVAVVNSEPITGADVRREMNRVIQQLAQQNRPRPDIRTLAPEVLDNLINLRAQLHFARETGMKVEESAIDQAEQTIALQNKFDVAELHRRVVRDGQTVKQFRAELADQILLQRVRERDVEPKVRVTDQELAQFLRDQPASQNLADMQMNLAHILVAVPDGATTDQVAALQARAQQALTRARAGEDFTVLVREYSNASNIANGGQLGLRTADRYPESFVQATLALSVGEVAALVRSPAGCHVLKVLEKSNRSLTPATFVQSHARHILLVPSARLSEAQARDKLLDFKKRVLAKQADFATLARENSQDGSAAKGGDLGWANPGMFVPEFEEVLNRLAPGEVSDPLASRFGLHLIELIERRQATLTPEQQRESVRASLREKKLAEAYLVWAQDIRARAYVELREPPL